MIIQNTPGSNPTELQLPMKTLEEWKNNAVAETVLCFSTGGGVEGSSVIATARSPANCRFPALWGHPEKSSDSIGRKRGM